MHRGLLGLVLCLAVCLSGCDSGAGKAKNRGGKGEGAVSGMKGTIKVEGSSTVEPITNQAKEQFQKKFPDVDISVGGQGTGNGFTSFAKKETDISDASRPIKEKELAACRASGLEFIELPVAYDGLTVVVNPKNTFIDQLTIEQLKKIFRNDGMANTWKDVNDSWPDEKISVFAPGTGSGTYDYFVEVVCTEKDADGKKIEIPLRNDEQISLNENDNILVDGVAREENAIGFFGYSYYDRNQEQLKAVKIVNPVNETAVGPSIETIASGEYAPLSRPLFIYVNVESLDRTEVSEFVDYYLANAKDLSEAAKYVGLTQEIYDTAKKHLEERITGTHFLDADGEKRTGSLADVYQASNIVTAEK